MELQRQIDDARAKKEYAKKTKMMEDVEEERKIHAELQQLKDEYAGEGRGRDSQLGVKTKRNPSNSPPFRQ